MLKIEAKVLECKERKYQENVYYELIVHNPDVENNNDFEMGGISSSKPYMVGSTIYITLKRNKDFKLVPRVVY